MANNGRYYGGTGDPYSREGRGTGTGRFKLFLIIGLAMAGFQAFKYYTNVQLNPITGENQRVQMTTEEETQMGLASAPQMAQQYGGLLQDQRAQQYVKTVCQKLVANTIASKAGYPFDFHVLADAQTVNAFALPGGQCFITAGLLARLKTPDQLAGVMGHEIGHVIHRHGAERSASQGFIQGLLQSVMIGAGGDPTLGNVANMVAQYSSMKYGRDQELESDDFGVRVMSEAGYNPEDLIGVMDILEEASGGQKVPEFQSTHPSPENRRQKIKEAIERYRKSGK
jgi:predicted Zn-dependent protease